MSLCTLNMMNVDMSAIRKAMGERDALRGINAPWISVLPPENEPDNGHDRLAKIARKLTKDTPDAIALVFIYFDDDNFWVEFVRNGRKIKTLSDSDSWAFAGQLFSGMYGSDAPKKVMRLMKSAMNLTERLTLVEQTIGTALYDTQLETPRRVEKSDEMYTILVARQKQLRKLRNKFALEPVPMEDWPEYVRACACLSDKPGIDRSHTLMEAQFRSNRILHKPWLAVNPEWNDTDRIFRIYDLKTDTIKSISVNRYFTSPIWITDNDETVFLECSDDGRGAAYVTCLNPDNTVKWRFAPEITDRYSLECVDVSADGILTIFGNKFTTTGILWRINSNDGSVICSRELFVHGIRYVEALDAFVAELPERVGILVLDGSLNEIKRMSIGSLKRFMPESMLLYGTEMWENFSAGHKYMGIDLSTGAMLELHPQTPVEVLYILSNGLFAGTTTELKSLMIFDREGNLLSKHKLNAFSIDSLPDGMPCAVEVEYNHSGVWPKADNIKVWAIKEL